MRAARSRAGRTLSTYQVFNIFFGIALETVPERHFRIEPHARTRTSLPNNGALKLRGEREPSVSMEQLQVETADLVEGERDLPLDWIRRPFARVCPWFPRPPTGTNGVRRKKLQ